ncbi:ATP-binding protein [Streptomyces sp. NPDC029674]|uniref:ATP-binding protein n=1 Tax=Streptomyces sp. NPDC029674 TaxID=3365297 RepID=UPI00384DCA8E
MESTEQRPGNLPPETTSMVGRRVELAQLRRLCGRSRLVTLTGVGGVGKSRLARRAAAGLRPLFKDGVWWVELTGLREGALLAHSIAEALSLADQSTRPMLDVVADHLADRELLLVLDTCEHLTDACAMAAEALLRAAPGLQILATSRRRLGLMAEEVLTVEPLRVPRGPQDMDGSEAVALLVERAAGAVPGFAVSAVDTANVLRLSQLLEGLPLAIELAAARLGEMPVDELVKRLPDRFGVLRDTGGAPAAAAAPPASGTRPRSDASDVGNVNDVSDVPRPAAEVPPWHRALRTTIGWSHELCTPAERLLWARLSVFAGSFDTEAAVAVCADEHLPEDGIPGLLGVLVDNSIANWLPGPQGSERFRMLDTLREYGAYWLRELGEEERLRHRHLAHYREFVRQADAGWLGPEQLGWYARTAAEHTNLRAALDFGLLRPAGAEGHAALELAGNLWFFWHACGFPREGEYYLAQALAADREPCPERGKALWAEGMVLVTLGKPAAAGARVAEIAAVADRFGCAATADRADTLSSIAAVMVGDHARAAALSQAVLDRHRCTPMAQPTQSAGFVRSLVYITEGRIDEAVAVLEHLRADCDRHSEQWSRAFADYMCARAELARGRVEAAFEHGRASWATKRRLDDSLGMAVALDVLGSAAAAAGDARRTAHLLGLAQQMWDTLGAPQIGVSEWIAARRTCEEQARRALGDDVYTAVFQTGYRTRQDAPDPLTPPTR